MVFAFVGDSTITKFLATSQFLRGRLAAGPGLLVSILAIGLVSGPARSSDCPSDGPAPLAPSGPACYSRPPQAARRRDTPRPRAADRRRGRSAGPPRSDRPAGSRASPAAPPPGISVNPP